MWTEIVDFYWYYLKGLRKYERHLIKYQGYGTRSILNFKRQNSLSWSTIEKLLSNLVILDGIEVRNHIRLLYESNKDLFDHPKTYISYFGPVGKSSGLILNQFLRCYPSKYWKLIPSTEIQELTDNSNIIFLDDFIGTGNQAIDYIKVIIGSINPSTNPYLFTIAGTSKGLKKIGLFTSRFKSKCSLLLDDNKMFLLDQNSTILTKQEKETIKNLNARLGITAKNEFHLGIPFAFYYSTPDNSLGILWNDNNIYTDINNVKRKWYGLIPREY